MKNLRQLLHAPNTLGDLSKKAFLQRQLNFFWQTAAPEFATFTTATELKNACLTIVTQQGAYASKIKLLAPSLLIKLNNLQKSHPDFAQFYVESIVVKVRVRQLEAPKKPSPPRTLSNQSINHIQQLEQSLDGSPLKTKLQHLLLQAKR